MNRDAARIAYARQKRGAKRRGIGWELTFEQWLSWWGDDLERRGRHAHQLQMQRLLDRGPYALGNIIKGRPKQNSRTWVSVRKNCQAEQARLAHEAALDVLPVESDDDDPDLERDVSLSEYFGRDPAPRSMFTP